jgi:hypothetical protein
MLFYGMFCIGLQGVDEALAVHLGNSYAWRKNGLFRSISYMGGEVVAGVVGGHSFSAAFIGPLVHYAAVYNLYVEPETGGVLIFFPDAAGRLIHNEPRVI